MLPRAVPRPQSCMIVSFTLLTQAHNPSHRLTVHSNPIPHTRVSHAAHISTPRLCLLGLVQPCFPRWTPDKGPSAGTGESPIQHSRRPSSRFPAGQSALRVWASTLGSRKGRVAPNHHSHTSPARPGPAAADEPTLQCIESYLFKDSITHCWGGGIDVFQTFGGLMCSGPSSGTNPMEGRP
jgi:hypothetical protein